MRELTLDIVDYPGEWLLDLPLLDKSYEQWSAETIRLSQSDRATAPEAWHDAACSLDPAAPDEPAAISRTDFHRVFARLPR